MSTRESMRSVDAMGAAGAAVVRTVAATGTPVVLLENGEPAAVIQDVASYRETRDALALVRLIARIDREVEAGETVPLETAFTMMRERLADS